MVFESPFIARAAEPGQFVQLEVSPGAFPLTRRPFTIDMAMDERFEVVFDVVGRGTMLLSRAEPGSRVRVLGPLGKGWRVKPGCRWLLIGGGLGAAGFPFLLTRAASATVLVGAATNDRLLSIPAPHRTLAATEDGSSGFRGLVTDLFGRIRLEDYDSIAVCGPRAMMHAVWRLLPRDAALKAQFSTESRMGCGWGVCDGCSIPVLDGGYSKCCTTGPVFSGTEIDWDRWKEIVH
jgi:dihydroorotate dehydrogenase electron transfer subunit